LHLLPSTVQANLTADNSILYNGEPDMSIESANLTEVSTQ